MRNILIIYPHWPPSNLTGVHRSRLVANYLPEYGWHPIVLTVHPDYYEEELDWELCRTVSAKIEVVHVKAWKVMRPRMFGDIGLRGFVYLYKKAISILRNRKIDFIWIPIPSYYVSLLGRLLNRKTHVHYGIDYIDPWIRNIRGRRNVRHILSNLFASVLEPLAIRKASLITGVAEGYYMPALKRNFEPQQIHAIPSSGQFRGQSDNRIYHVEFPYGYDPTDYELVLKSVSYPWASFPKCKPFVYAGAFLPRSIEFINALFKSVRQLIDEEKWDNNVHLYFLGTGSYRGKTIQSYASDFGINHLVHESQNRFSFLEIIAFLKKSYAVMIIGSTERHYTASKVFSSVMTQRPLFVILHQNSSACNVLKEVKADQYLVSWHEDLSSDLFQKHVQDTLYLLLYGNQNWSADCSVLTDTYSSFESARILAGAIDFILAPNSKAN